MPSSPLVSSPQPTPSNSSPDADSVAVGVRVLTAWATCPLRDYFDRHAEAQAFCDELASQRPAPLARDFLLSTVAPEAVRQLAASGETDNAETLLLFIGSLRIGSAGEVLGNNATAAGPLAELEKTLAAYRSA